MTKKGKKEDFAKESLDEQEQLGAWVMKAYAWRSGQIGFNMCVPGDALEIAEDRNAARLKRTIIAIARHAYDNKTLLVPGIPEAVNEDAALDALIRFRTEVRKRL